MTKRGHTYTPGKTRAWEQAAALCCKARRPPLFEGPLRVTVVVIRSRPKRLLRKCDPDGLLWAPKRPDLDNYVKATLDALQLAGVFVDDGQIVELSASKYYAERGGLPRVVASVVPCAPTPFPPRWI